MGNLRSSDALLGFFALACLVCGQDDGEPASHLGYQYKVVVPVYQNRSKETYAWLEAGNGTKLMTFRVR